MAPVAGRALELQGNPGGVIVDGFAFIGSLNGASGVIESTTGATDGLQLLNNYVEVAAGFTASALFLNKNAIDATIDQNVFVAATGSTQAVFFDGPDQFHGLHFTNNDVLRNGATGGTGVFVDGNRNIGTSVSLRTPLVQGNLFQGHALGFNAGQRSFANAQIVENTFTNNTGGLAGGPLNSSIARNSFTTNSLYGLRLTAFGNTADPTRGAQNVTVTNNVFSGNGTTVDLVNGYGDIRIDDQFNGTQSTNTISNNSLGSSIAIFNRETNPEVVNASGNWFGTTTEASVIAKVLGPAAANVDVTPYLGSGTDTDLVTPGFQGGTASLFVTAQLAQAGVTGRIQEAVNLAASTATITVTGGTYSGDVTPSTKAIAFNIGESTALVTINGHLTLDADDSLALDINGTLAGSGYDQLAVNGVVTLGNSVLTTTTGFTPAAGDTFRLIDNDLADSVSGTFFGLPGGSKFVSGGKTFYIHYSGPVAGDGNDVTLRVNVIPTTTGIADVEVAEDAANTVFSLYPSFADQEDLDPALTYTVTGNTNSALFSSVSINNSTGEFTLDYAADLNSPANGGPATITVRATDTDGDYVETSFDVTITEVNDAPTGVNDTIPFYIGPGTRTIAMATLLANDIRGPLNENPQTLSLIAVGSALPSGATVSISGSDVLYTPPLGYSGPASFVYTLEDNGTTNGVADPLTSTATANLFFLFPGVALPAVDLNGPLANFGNSVTYTENNPAVNLTTNTATVTDSDSTYLLSITATLMAAPNGVDEVLSAVTTGTSITSSYNSTTRVLTLMGPDTATNFQQVLRTVAYQNLSEDPKTTARTVRFVASDGANLSSFRDATISITATADAPSSSGTTTGLTYVENAGNMIVFPDISANDPDSSYFVGGGYSYGLTKATITISPYFADQDRLNYTNVGIGGSFNTTSGVFTLNGTQTLAKYNDALRLITYQNLSENPNTTPRTISVVVFDSTAGSAPLSRVISVTSVNDAPLVDLNGPIATGGNHAVTYHTGSGSPLTLAYSTSTLTDADNTSLTSLTVTITNPQNGANEVIYYTLPGGISASAPSGTAGTVVFTGSASPATYQTLMRSIQYRNLAGAPTLSPARLVTFAANDGTGTPTAIGTSTTTVTLVSPLVASGSPTTIDKTRLTQSQLTSIVTAAITRWSDLGLNAEQLATLRNTSYVIADFGATNLLGTAASGQVITLDDNAAGFGWFVDSTPLADEEFPVEISGSERRAPGMRKMDLLTVVMHEMGHILGLPDIDDHDSTGVMTDALAAGTRRLCTEEDLAMLAFYLAQNSSTTDEAGYDADAIRAEVFSRWS
ncbi:MAG: hypothetical protein JNM18_00640 [Planctomycetaceae bacterium]|nr:hypothetical protein [Planctomycetaceae bacterium]